MKKLQLKIKNQKKMQDLLFVIITLLTIAMTLFIFLYVGQKIDTAISSKFNSEVNGSGTVMTTTLGIVNNTSDWAFMTLFILLILSLIISSFMIYTHPVFVVVFIIMLTVFITASVYVANVYYEFSRIPEFATALENMPMTDYILTNLPLITLILGVLSIIIIYSKSQGQISSSAI